jgi:hypothetical protein
LSSLENFSFKNYISLFINELPPVFPFEDLFYLFAFKILESYSLSQDSFVELSLLSFSNSKFSIHNLH